MSAVPNDLAANELAIFFQTNEQVPARALLNFIYEVDRIARTKRHFGPDALVEILEVRTGTKLVKLSIESKLAAATLVVALAAFANDISLRIQQSSGRLAQSVAQMCIENGVVECEIRTSDTHIKITREEIRAVPILDRRRSVEGLTGYGNRYGLDYGGVSNSPALNANDREHRRTVRKTEDALPAAAGPSRSRAMDLVGKFVKVAGQNAVVFETGENVFDVSLTSASLREVPLDQDVIARCTFDWADASTVFVHSWRLAKA
jgi:hypothetical protein